VSRILLVVHGWPPAASGGTEVHARALASALVRRGDRVSVLARESDPERAELAVRTLADDDVEVKLVNNTFADTKTFADTYRWSAMRSVVSEQLDRACPDVVQIEHLTCLTTDLVDEVVARGLPCVVTLNDYWLLCHRGQLLDVDLERCSGPTAAGCARCHGPIAAVGPVALSVAQRLRRLAPGLTARLGRVRAPVTEPAVAAARQRIAHMRRLFGRIDRFLAPSRALRDRFVEHGVAADQIEHWPQGIERARFASARAGRTRSERLRIGYLGSLMVSKGAHVLLEAFAALARARVELTVLGGHADYHGDASYRTRLEPLLTLPGVTHHGAVAPAAIPERLAALDVLVVPSVWLENAPFVIREAFAAGLPVVASDLGGMAEMVRDGVDGLRFRTGDATDLARVLQRLLDEPDLLARLQAGVESPPSIDEEAERLARLHASLLRRRSATPTRPRVGAVVLNYRTPIDAVLCLRALERSSVPVDPVVVVDNASGDGSAELLARAAPAARLILSESNLGYPAGMNVGARAAFAAGCDAVWLLNADAIPQRDCLGQLLGALDRRADAGIVGPLVLERSDPERIASFGLEYRQWSGRMRQLGAGHERADVAAGVVLDRDAVSGCALLITRSAWDQAGPFVEPYFFSLEDVDLGMRVRAAGFACVVASDAIVYHQGGAALPERSARRLRYAARNQLLLASRTPAMFRGHGQLRTLAVAGYCVLHALVTSGAPRVRGLAAVARGVVDHLTGRYGEISE